MKYYVTVNDAEALNTYNHFERRSDGLKETELFQENASILLLLCLHNMGMWHTAVAWRADLHGARHALSFIDAEAKVCAEEHPGATERQ